MDLVTTRIVGPRQELANVQWGVKFLHLCHHLFHGWRGDLVGLQPLLSFQGNRFRNVLAPQNDVPAICEM